MKHLTAIFLLSAIIVWRNLVISKPYMNYSQRRDSLILWNSNTKLTFDDFIDLYHAGEKLPSAAETHYRIGYKYIVYNDTFSIISYCEFNRNTSFIKVHDSDLLAHEQLHFDIAEVYMRRLRYNMYRIIKSQSYRLSELDRILSLQYAKSISQCDSAEDKYDLQTKHGVDKHYHQKWQLATAVNLIALGDYADTVMTFHLPLIKSSKKYR